MFKKRFIRLGEIWFGHEEPSTPGDQVDVLQYFQHPTPVQTPGIRVDPFHTLIVDLTRTPEEVLNAVKKDTRYEIRRATEKDQLQNQFWTKPDTRTIQEFCGFFGCFAAEKGLEMIRIDRMLDYSRMGALDLSQTLTPDGEALTWHAHLVQGKRARLLYSASIKGKGDSAHRSLLGRANRYHHWNDILRFKGQGVQVYDLGGWYSGSEDVEKLKINHFKEEFGGVPETSYHCEGGVTPKGTAYLLARRLRGQLMQARKALKKALRRS